jgi:hypothetical protein
VANLIEVPARIRTDITQFSEQFERSLKGNRE